MLLQLLVCRCSVLWVFGAVSAKGNLSVSWGEGCVGAQAPAGFCSSLLSNLGGYIQVGWRSCSRLASDAQLAAAAVASVQMVVVQSSGQHQRVLTTPSIPWLKYFVIKKDRFASVGYGGQCSCAGTPLVCP